MQRRETRIRQPKGCDQEHHPNEGEDLSASRKNRSENPALQNGHARLIIYRRTWFSEALVPGGRPYLESRLPPDFSSGVTKAACLDSRQLEEAEFQAENHNTMGSTSHLCRTALALIAAITVAGCVVVDRDRATLESPLPLGNGAEHRVLINKVVGSMRFNPHAGVFSRSLAVYSVWLAHPPDPARPTYSWREVRIVEFFGSYEQINATGGSVTIDRDAKSVKVEYPDSVRAVQGQWRLPTQRSLTGPTIS